MRRSVRIVEVIFLLCLISGLAWWQRPQAQAPTEDLQVLELQQQIFDDWRAGKLDGCRASCHRLLGAERGNMVALRYLGMLAVREGDLKAAHDYFNKGIAQEISGLELFNLSSRRQSGLYRERARLHIVERNWKAALEDAEKARARVSSYDQDGKLAEDVWACAQVGAGNITEAKNRIPSGWEPNEVTSLLSLHRTKLGIEVDPPSAVAPLWHPPGCPICALPGKKFRAASELF